MSGSPMVWHGCKRRVVGNIKENFLENSKQLPAHSVEITLLLHFPKRCEDLSELCPLVDMYGMLERRYNNP